MTLVLSILSTPVMADDWLDNPPAGALDPTRSSFVAEPSLSATQAAAQVRRAHGGRVLSVSPSRRGDSLGYRVRVLVDGGRVKTVYVRSGQISSGSATPRSPVRTIGDG